MFKSGSVYKIQHDEASLSSLTPISSQKSEAS